MKRLIIVLFLACSSMTYAETSKAPTEAPIIEETISDTTTVASDFQKTFVRMIVTLVALIGFLILTFWSLKKLMASKQSQKNSTQTIKILEKRNLSPKTLLYLIEVEDKRFLISESQNEIRSLKPLQEDITPQSSE